MHHAMTYLRRFLASSERVNMQIYIYTRKYIYNFPPHRFLERLPRRRHMHHTLLSKLRLEGEFITPENKRGRGIAGHCTVKIL